MSRTVPPKDLRVRGYGVARQEDLIRALGSTAFGLYCALLDVRATKDGTTLAALSDVVRKVIVEKRGQVPAPLTLSGAKKRLRVLEDAGLVRTVSMVPRKKGEKCPNPGWRARRMVYGCLIGPVVGTVYVPKATETWLKAERHGHGGKRWTAETHPETARALHALQRKGGETTAAKTRGKPKKRPKTLAEWASEPWTAPNRDIYAESFEKLKAVKRDRPKAVKWGLPPLSSGAENTNNKLVVGQPSSPSETPVPRRAAAPPAGAVEATAAAPRGDAPSVAAMLRASSPVLPPSAASEVPDGPTVPPAAPTPVNGQGGGSLSDRFEEAEARRVPAAPPSLSVEALQQRGLPRLPNAHQDGLVVDIPGAEGLCPQDTLERKVELVRRAYEGAVVTYAGMKRPKVLGHPRPMKPSKGGLWPLYVKAVAAFEARNIAPAAWFAYWVDTWWRDHPGEAPPLKLVLNEQTILKPRGFFSGPATDYTSRWTIVLPEVRAYMVKREQLIGEAQNLANPTRADLVGLAARFFPDGVAAEVDALRELVAHEEREQLAARAAGRWVWERRGTKPPAPKPDRKRVKQKVPMETAE